MEKCLRVLIVDDDYHIGECLSKRIDWKSIGYEIVGIAYTGEEGCKLALSKQPDVIISDVVMPEMDGTELFDVVQDNMTGVSFIFLSAYDDFSTAQFAVKHHIDDFVLKPLTKDKLVYLTNLLVTIRKRKEKVALYRSLLIDANGEMRTALKKRDESYFKALFDMLEQDASDRIIDATLINSISDRLIELLSADQGLSDAARLNWQTEFEMIRRRKEKVHYLRERFVTAFSENTAQTDRYHAELMTRIIRYIDQNISDSDLTVGSLARHFGYSPNTVTRLFRCYMKEETVSSYIARKRMEYATQLLRETEYPINMVAQKAGFSSPSYFAHTFGQIYGKSPKKYRATMHDR